MQEFLLDSAVINGDNPVWDAPIPQGYDGKFVVACEFPDFGTSVFAQLWAEGALSGYREFAPSLEIEPINNNLHTYTLFDSSDLYVCPSYMRVWQLNEYAETSVLAKVFLVS